jgi:hypothetical protein
MYKSGEGSKAREGIKVTIFEISAERIFRPCLEEEAEVN